MDLIVQLGDFKYIRGKIFKYQNVMKKIVAILMLIAMLLAGSTTLEAKKTTKKSTKKSTTSATLPINKGEMKQYGDYLSTQKFTIKKGKDNELTLEYPIDGKPELVDSIRSYIKNSLNPKFAGSLDTPEALMRSVMKTKKDLKYGGDGESLKAVIKVIYHSSNIVTYDNNGYEYFGGAHGTGWEIGTTFLVEDGSIFNEGMFTSIDATIPYIMDGFEDLDALYDPNEPVTYLGNVSITDEGIIVLYQFFYDDIVKSVLNKNDVYNLLTPKGKKFLK